MSDLPILFDAVLFDLDGTLVATDLFWVSAARIGARRAFEELGIEREQPSAEQWMGMVGLPLEQAFRAVFADLDEAQRKVVYTRCVEEEEAALRAGGAALLPGAREALVALRELGLRTAIASNCGQGYLDTMLNDLGLGELVHEARCLDTAGVRDKAEMIGDLLRTFGTRSAVMVGDRRGDAEAAHANALPHVHLSRGFAPGGEQVEAEATVADLGELLPRLAGRARWIEGALRGLGAFARHNAPRTIGITGHTASGKTLFARDAARLLDAGGRAAHVVALDDFLRPEAGEGRAARHPEGDHLAEVFDVEALVSSVLEPHRRGEPARDPHGVPIPAEALVLLEGPFLLHPQLRLVLDRTLYLEVGEPASLARVAALAAGSSGGAERMARVRGSHLPAQAAFDRAFDPHTRADLVLDAENPLGPAPE